MKSWKKSNIHRNLGNKKNAFEMNKGQERWLNNQSRMCAPAD